MPKMHDGRARRTLLVDSIIRQSRRAFATFAVSLIGVDGDESSWQQFDDIHRIALKRLQASNADFVVTASHTPHHCLSAIVSGVDIPVLKLFEAVAQHCQSEDHRDVMILRTALTMRSLVLHDAFSANGINASAPAGNNHRQAVLALIATLQRGESDGALYRRARSRGNRAPVHGNARCMHGLHGAAAGISGASKLRELRV